ncbi:MAG: hypothetical protein HQK49_07685 [Oligoflexia bacterium]|nr:hypothetical protein [Oligoflexia bacterium]
MVKILDTVKGSELQHIDLTNDILADTKLSKLQYPNVFSLLFSAKGDEIYMNLCKKIKKWTVSN